MKERQIALLGNELVIREDIRIDELYELYPQVILRMTAQGFTQNPDYIINGLDHIILKVETLNTQFIVPKIEISNAFLRPYFNPVFLGKESSDNIYMRFEDDRGLPWRYEWFLFDDLYTYGRPNDISDIPKDFRWVKFVEMKEFPIKHMDSPYCTELGDMTLIPI